MLFGGLEWKIWYLNQPDTPEEHRLAFKHDGYFLVRRYAVEGANLDSTRLAFKDDPDADVREAAVRGAKLDSTRLAFKMDPDSHVRARAVLGARSDETRLVFMLDHDPYVRKTAARTLQSITALQKALHQEKNPDVRLVILERARQVKASFQEIDAIG